jgi:hypothetical protein
MLAVAGEHRDVDALYPGSASPFQPTQRRITMEA